MCEGLTRWIVMAASKKGSASIRIQSTTEDKEVFLKQLKDAGFCFAGLKVSVFRIDDLVVKVKALSQ